MADEQTPNPNDASRITLSRKDIGIAADAVWQTHLSLSVHFWLAESGLTPENDLLPPQNTLLASSRLLGWVTAMLEGHATGATMPPLPDLKAVNALRSHLQRARWSESR